MQYWCNLWWLHSVDISWLQWHMIPTDMEVDGYFKYFSLQYFILWNINLNAVHLMASFDGPRMTLPLKIAGPPHNISEDEVNTLFGKDNHISCQKWISIPWNPQRCLGISPQTLIYVPCIHFILGNCDIKVLEYSEIDHPQKKRWNLDEIFQRLQLLTPKKQS